MAKPIWITVATLALLAAAGTTVWFVNVLKPTSPTAFLFFTAWLAAPYVGMAAALLWARRRTEASWQWDAIAILVAAGGVIFLANVIFWRPDAQGAIAVFMAPLYQGVAFVLLALVAGWMSRR